jgi:hypothetical protein
LSLLLIILVPLAYSFSGSSLALLLFFQDIVIIVINYSYPTTAPSGPRRTCIFGPIILIIIVTACACAVPPHCYAADRASSRDQAGEKAGDAGGGAGADRRMVVVVGHGIGDGGG